MPPADKKVALRVTPLDELKRKGKVLQGPAKSFNLQFSSWVEDAMPELLWATLVVTHLPREDALACFRRILNKVGLHKAVLPNRRLEHSRLAELDQASFDLFFAEECALPEVAHALAPLLVLEDLPDKALWKSLLPDQRGLEQAGSCCSKHLRSSIPSSNRLQVVQTNDSHRHWKFRLSLQNG